MVFSADEKRKAFSKFRTAYTMLTILSDTGDWEIVFCERHSTPDPYSLWTSPPRDI
jgi:hypothetical protein